MNKEQLTREVETGADNQGRGNNTTQEHANYKPKHEPINSRTTKTQGELRHTKTIAKRIQIRNTLGTHQEGDKL